MILTTPCRSAGAYGLWVQPMRDGSTEYIQLIWMLFYTLVLELRIRTVIKLVEREQQYTSTT